MVIPKSHELQFRQSGLQHPALLSPLKKRKRPGYMPERPFHLRPEDSIPCPYFESREWVCSRLSAFCLYHVSNALCASKVGFALILFFHKKHGLVIRIVRPETGLLIAVGLQQYRIGYADSTLRCRPPFSSTPCKGLNLAGQSGSWLQAILPFRSWPPSLRSRRPHNRSPNE